ncbi:hypothetical protein VAPA_1c32680 [Variovorax paradoxus B4]|uniref:Uncharacterized protein n=1 Tax=Variovorax paradoxus B4 TaxID=1246301 RepID=T1XDE9_VARPD|nr:hypothetical protein VAPA_1c32680 [Variovorax paradoxus B4]
MIGWQQTRMTDMRLVLLAIASALTLSAHAANYPCSGSKGGVARCNGEIFVCNDGSISGSKKSCIAEMGGTANSTPAPAARAIGDTGCSCRSGRICVGPRGGEYCLSDSGAKSYRRK